MISVRLDPPIARPDVGRGTRTRAGRGVDTRLDCRRGDEPEGVRELGRVEPESLRPTRFGAWARARPLELCGRGGRRRRARTVGFSFEPLDRLESPMAPSYSNRSTSKAYWCTDHCQDSLEPHLPTSWIHSSIYSSF